MLRRRDGRHCSWPARPRAPRPSAPPAGPGCAHVEGRVVTHDSLPATDVSVTAESADTTLHPDAYFGSARTSPEGRFELKVLVQPGVAVPDADRVRLIARRIPPPGAARSPADTVVVRTPFASHGGVPDSVHVEAPAPPTVTADRARSRRRCRRPPDGGLAAGSPSRPPGSAPPSSRSRCRSPSRSRRARSPSGGACRR